MEGNTVRTKTIKAERKHFGLYRAILSCKVASDALDHTAKCPPNVTPQEYAIYNLIQAVREIAEHLHDKETNGKP
jgi:hypothetical protein